MKVPNRASPELLYQLAQDFIKLNRVTKYRIGFEMNLLDAYDTLGLTEEQAETRVFGEAYKQGKLELLIAKMYEPDYER